VATSPASSSDSKHFYYASEVPIAPGGQESSTGEEYLHEDLPPDLLPELMPKHVAIIMDGNARWAKGRGMHLSFGHAAGAEALMRVARVASSWGIEALTVFAFSTENWRRPQVRIDSANPLDLKTSNMHGLPSQIVVSSFRAFLLSQGTFSHRIC
jgi:hypothetical protein